MQYLVIDAITQRFALFGRSMLDPYKQQLLEWWNGGVRQPAILMSLLKQQGYSGSDRTLSRYISRLRQAQGLPPTRVKVTQALAKVSDPQLPPFTAQRASFLIVKPQKN